MNILLVAPEHPDLPFMGAEVAAVSNQHDAVRLVGVVRDSDIAQAVQEGPYDLVWIASHGGDQGVLLSDGMLSIAGVGQYLRTSGARLCFINTCDSENVALSIISSGAADMICTIGEVGDNDATRLGILLAGELGRSDDFYEAYLAVRPEGGKYRYYRAGPSAPTRRHLGDDYLRDIRDRLMRIETRLDIELPQLKSQNERLEAQIAQFKAMPLVLRLIVIFSAVVIGVLLGTVLQGFV